MPHPRVVGIVLMGVISLTLLGLYASSFRTAHDTYVGPYSSGYYDGLDQAQTPAWMQLHP